MRRFLGMAAPAAKAGATATQLNGHGHSHGHGHGSHAHAHSHGSIEKNISGKHLRQCQIATLTGGATNVFFCGTKLWIGSAGGSVALVADGFHALTDIIADIVSYVAISLSRKKLPRCRFPLGIGRLETSGAVIVAAILFFGGVALLVQSLEQCFSDVTNVLATAAPTGGIAAALMLSVRRAVATVTGGVPPAALLPAVAYDDHDHAPGEAHDDDHGHSHGGQHHGHSHGGGDHHGHSHFEVTHYDEATGTQVVLWTMVAIAAASVVCKELLFRWTRSVGLRAGSRVVVANAYHHRADAWSGGVALVGVAGHVMGLPGVDAVAGLVVSLSICKIGYGLFKDAVLEFFDYQNADEVSAIREQLQKFNLRIVRGVDVVPNHAPLTTATASSNGGARIGDTSARMSASFVEDADGEVDSKLIHFINVFLVRHGHQYALHVTLLVYETVPAHQIQAATDLITALARGSLQVQDTFTTLLLCSNQTQPREEFLGSGGDRAAEAEVLDEGVTAASGCGESCSHADDGDAAPPTIAATGTIVNPSLERCITALQEFHTFTSRIHYNWEERTITSPTSESCECERDILSVAEMFKCHVVGGHVAPNQTAAAEATQGRGCNGHAHTNGKSNGHSHMNGNSNGHSHMNGKSNGHSHMNGKSNGHSHMNGNSNGHSHMNGKSNGHAHTNGHSNGHAHTNGKSNGHTH
ncbi:cation transporter [Novymonas esmeraldas]|uniref:Cation transporter n=1 Tax=Novymonas esmeraldas TaxID=1808958 RepID=A0AAW0EW25_9TRYP